MSADPFDPLVEAATRAYDNMSDGVFTAEDVAVYRAWLVWLRMTTPGRIRIYAGELAG